RSPGAARVWAFTILRSIFLRRIERQSRTAGVDVIDWPLLEAGEVLQDTYESLRPIQDTPLGEVREALQRLPLPYREPLVLAHVGGFSYKEISEILAIPLGTVMPLLVQAARAEAVPTTLRRRILGNLRTTEPARTRPTRRLAMRFGIVSGFVGLAVLGWLGAERITPHPLTPLAAELTSKHLLYGEG